MRDYDNLPVLDWTDQHSALKAKAQILHEEPVILQMPDDFDCIVDAAECNCQENDDPGLLLNCDGGEILNRLAEANDMPGLRTVAEACVEAGSRVDVDITGNRLIVHD